MSSFSMATHDWSSVFFFLVLVFGIPFFLLRERGFLPLEFDSTGDQNPRISRDHFWNFFYLLEYFFLPGSVSVNCESNLVVIPFIEEEWGKTRREGGGETGVMGW
jgi:hypothetical protein